MGKLVWIGLQISIGVGIDIGVLGGRKGDLTAVLDINYKTNQQRISLSLYQYVDSS